MRHFFFLQCAVFIHLCPRLSRARIRFCMCPRIQCAEPQSWVASLGSRCQTGAASPSRAVWDDTWRLSERAPLLAFGYGVYHQHCCSLIAFHFCEDRAVFSLFFSFFFYRVGFLSLLSTFSSRRRASFQNRYSGCGIPQGFYFAGNLSPVAVSALTFPAFEHTFHLRYYIGSEYLQSGRVCALALEPRVCGMESEVILRQVQHSRPKQDRKLCGYA